MKSAAPLQLGHLGVKPDPPTSVAFNHIKLYGTKQRNSPTAIQNEAEQLKQPTFGSWKYQLSRINCHKDTYCMPWSWSWSWGVVFYFFTRGGGWPLSPVGCLLWLIGVISRILKQLTLAVQHQIVSSLPVVTWASSFPIQFLSVFLSSLHLSSLASTTPFTSHTISPSLARATCTLSFTV